MIEEGWIKLGVYKIWGEETVGNQMSDVDGLITVHCHCCFEVELLFYFSGKMKSGICWCN